MVKKSSLLSEWQFVAVDDPDCIKPEFNCSGSETVYLPHSVATLPHRYFPESAAYMVCWYRTVVNVEFKRREERVYLEFGRATGVCQIYVNGRKAGEHLAPFTPFHVEITKHMESGHDNVIAVRLDTRQVKEDYPTGKLADALVIGGLTGAVSLRVEQTTHIKRTTCVPVLTAKTAKLAVEVETNEFCMGEVLIELLDASGEQVASKRKRITGSKVDFTLSRLKISEWKPDSPVMYTLKAMLLLASDTDFEEVSFGFRQIQVMDSRVCLNGEPIKLVGSSRLGVFPYVCLAAPERLELQEADILRYSLGFNAVRCKIPPTSAFLDRCDQIGLMVIAEVSTHHVFGKPDIWKGAAIDTFSEMIHEFMNHPSVIGWSLAGDTEVEATFNQSAAQLITMMDTSRPLFGFAAAEGESFVDVSYCQISGIEDVPESKSACIVCTDDMLPRQLFSWAPIAEGRRLSLAHASWVSKVMEDDTVSGILFDTFVDHQAPAGYDAGDRVRYTGIVDQFRFRKLPAAFYHSQVSPDEGLVLEPVWDWLRGLWEDVPPSPFYVFSNCDTIEMKSEGHLFGTAFADSNSFPGLVNPPLLFDELTPPPGESWQDFLGDVELIGYRAGKPVAKRGMAADGMPCRLLAALDDDQLHADGVDMTRLSFSLADKYGNLVWHASGVINVECDGPVDIIGPTQFPLEAGHGAVYVRAGTKRGQGTILVKAAGFETVKLKLTLR